MFASSAVFREVSVAATVVVVVVVVVAVAVAVAVADVVVADVVAAGVAYAVAEAVAAAEAVVAAKEKAEQRGVYPSMTSRYSVEGKEVNADHLREENCSWRLNVAITREQGNALLSSLLSLLT